MAQGTAFTYQGQLTGSNNPVHGTYDLTFKLWNASSGGSQVGSTITATGTVISNGLFTVVLDFGSQYNGTSYWLELGVRTNGASLFTTLSPRQQLTPTPYAITAENVDGAVPVSQLTGILPSADLSGTYANPLTLNNAGNVFDGNGAGLTGVNAAQLNGLTAASFWQLTGNAGTTAGVNFLGTTDNQPLEIHVNGQRVLRVEPDGSGYTTPNVIGGSANFVSNGAFGATIGGGGGSLGPNSVTNDFGTIAGGVHNISGQQAAVGGGYLNTAGAINATVGGGFDNVNSGAEATIGGGYGNNVSGYVATVPGGYKNTAAGSYSFAAGYYAQALNDGSFVWSDDSSSTPFASTTNNQFLIRATGGVGIGTASPSAALEVANGDVRIDSNRLLLVSGTTTNYGLVYVPSGLPGVTADGPCLFGYNGGALGGLFPTTYSLTWDWHGNVWVSNNCSVGTLTIRGGADLAEPFNITSGNDEVPQGAVVVIDEQNPGHLKLSDRPYDTRVAGVVSGANGVNPGIQMHQDGLIEGGKNVALTGRVYVLADASTGAIRPGDMLTTSGLPGYAMKVSDQARAFSAILGKAMTGLSEGKGLVLVLVTLQ